MNGLFTVLHVTNMDMFADKGHHSYKWYCVEFPYLIHHYFQFHLKTAYELHMLMEKGAVGALNNVQIDMAILQKGCSEDLLEIATSRNIQVPMLIMVDFDYVEAIFYEKPKWTGNILTIPERTDLFLLAQLFDERIDLFLDLEETSAAGG